MMAHLANGFLLGVLFTLVSLFVAARTGELDRLSRWIETQAAQLAKESAELKEAQKH